MLKQTVSYKDFNDELTTDVLYFNLTKDELIEMSGMEPRLQAWSEKTQGENRTLTTDEIRELLNILKELIERSYGVRSEDGKRFRKSAEIFDDFKSSAAYEAFLFSLFEPAENAIKFMQGIMPKDLADQIAAMPDVPLTNAPLPANNEIKAVDEEVPAWVREDREPTQAEFSKMSREQMQEAFRLKQARS